MKVAIHHDGKYGFIDYNEGNREIMVSHPDERVRNTVRHYLTNERVFTVPADNDLKKRGNRMLISKVPNEDTGTMLMALTEMHHHTGVHVDWGHDDNRIKNLLANPNQPDPNAKADKPIIKSVYGDFDYEIIN